MSECVMDLSTAILIGLNVEQARTNEFGFRNFARVLVNKENLRTEMFECLYEIFIRMYVIIIDYTIFKD